MKKHKVFSLLVLAFFTGLIIASCLDFTKGSEADEKSVVNSSSTAVPLVSLPDFSVLAEKALPAVVNISSTKIVKVPQQAQQLYRFFYWFFPGQPNPNKPQQKVPPQEFRSKSLGSGFIIDKDGYIVTNYHVIDGADEVEVSITPDIKYEAKIIGKDKKTDLALIKINSKKPLHYLSFGDSTKAKIGQWVLAIGNPFGLSHTVTHGIISAKGRVLGVGPYDNFIQTDAPINPGNSGGPLLNIHGQVIGINSAIYTKTGQSAGIGFAIPSSIAISVIKQLKKHGKVTRGWLGVKIQKITPTIAKGLGLKSTEGALVAEVIKGTPAYKGGIKRGDIITKFNNSEVKNFNDLPLIVADTPPGKKVEVEILRQKGNKWKSITLHLKITEMKNVKENEESGNEEEEESAKIGLRLKNLNQNEKDQLGITKGVLIVSVSAESPAAENGLQPGDVILQLNRKDTNNAKDVLKIIKRVHSGDPLLFLIYRKGEGTIWIAFNKP